MTSNSDFNPSVREIVDFANSQGVQSTMVMMDTAMAQRILLERNTGNRKIRLSRVFEYAEAMKKGQWAITHQGIAISRSGILLDGQHRLLAVIRSGVTVPMQVTMNVPDESFPTIDCGTPRGAHDRLRKPKRHVEVAQFFCDMTKDLSGIAERSAGNPRDHIDRLAHVLEVIEPAMYRFDAAAPKTTPPVISSVGVRAACLFSTFTGTPEPYAFGLYRNLVSGELEDLPQIALALVRRLIKKDLVQGIVQGTSLRIEIFFRVLDVFRPKYANRRYLAVPAEGVRENIKLEMRGIFK
jgi:hypothetical protein